MTPILIDVDVYRAIETGRLDLDETHNFILRRLLGVQAVSPQVIEESGPPQKIEKPDLLTQKNDESQKSYASSVPDNLPAWAKEAQLNTLDKSPSLVIADPPPPARWWNDAGAWFWKGVKLPKETQLRMVHNHQEYQGKIHQGHFYVDGIRAKSPSQAAISVIQKRTGVRTSLNGWIYWMVKLPDSSEWILLDHLRSKA